MRTLFISVFAAFALVACNGVKADSTNDAANDSTKVEETVKGDDFISPDLAFFNLHGPVHTLKVNDIVFEFDKNGTFVKADGRDPFLEPTREMDEDGSHTDIIGYERNEEGYISESASIESVTEYIWLDGQVIREEFAGEGMIGKTIYTHNEDGTIAYAAESWSSEGEEECEDEECESNDPDGVISYSDYKKDSHGNWISRTAKTTTATNTETRTITYYE